MNNHEAIHADFLRWAPTQPANRVNLVFGSPPYEDARTYGMKQSRRGEEWVAWMVEVVQQSLRICSGLVAFVVEGRARQFRWSAIAVLLMADLHRKGIHLRKPPVFHRVGIPGSGGPDWWRNDYEFIVCATNGGELPWSDNTVMGAKCKHAVGGEMSYRNSDGVRKNQRHRTNTGKLHTKREADGTMRIQKYIPPKLANPGNVIHCKVGGGSMGSKLAHENEAPFPESLVEFFVRSFCPPDGVVLDPFAGSGTVAAVCEQHGRDSMSVDIRESQIKLVHRRIVEATQQPMLF